MSDKTRILLVDDEPSILKVVGKRLELSGYEVIEATDGAEAVEKARTLKPDLIILDLMLPRLNGYEVCTLLKGDRRYQEIPIVLFSARGQESDVALGKSCGADGYVMKPFSRGRVLHRSDGGSAHAICERVVGLLERGVVVSELPENPMTNPEGRPNG